MITPYLVPLSDGLDSISVDEFFPPAILFEGTPFELNRVMLVRLISVTVVSIILLLASSKAKVIPSRAQVLVEMVFEFVRKNIVCEIIQSKKIADTVTPLITFIFLGIFSMNITGIIPGLNIAGSSVVGIPLVYAIVSYVAFIYIGIRVNGVGKFFKSQLILPDIPKILYPLFILIEFFSTFIVRPFTLVIRLLANMIAGHLLLVLFFIATNIFIFSLSIYTALAPITMALSIAIYAFEIFVAALQAYIFALLSAVYVQLSVEH
ncbi:F0F1 ATP synthase subunit A [Actinomyces sp. zg-332]|uniref:F0F1 ATP synthase subunit A n=1 Tax=Actinomyces sp. zg-332 TaxID=2708340 RepID=UPI0014235A65|nr:F0F1 ATP synthase subunit A [Actinomyces sp. zg-332]QPK94726.1 F0F1 ATP synthase subunit A [Actinomyces sp. zg-332]